MTPKQRAEEIVRKAWDRAPHLQLETVLIEAIEAAIKEKKIEMPSPDDGRSMLEEYINRPEEPTAWGVFYKTCQWMRDEILKRNQNKGEV